MRREKLLVAVVTAGVFCMTSAAHATEAWYQIPGAATEISVAANDFPFVRGGGNDVYWLNYVNQCTYTCATTCQTLCTIVRPWVDTHTVVQHVAVDMFGYPWWIDGGGQLWYGLSNAGSNFFYGVPQSTTTLACVNSFIPGYLDEAIALPVWPNTPTAWGCGGHICYVGNTNAWAVGCGTTPASVITLNNLVLTFTDIPVYRAYYTANGWSQVGAGQGNVASEIAQFTVDGTQLQNPWIVANNNVYVYNGTYFRQVTGPRPLGINVGAAHITDHYVVDNSGYVWRWMGDAYGNPGNPPWHQIIGPTPIAPIAKIASAEKLFGTAQGNVGPSRLYALDTQNRIYVAGDAVTGPPPK
jgi:hypothetical protein